MDRRGKSVVIAVACVAFFGTLTACGGGGDSSACETARTQLEVARALSDEANMEYDKVYENPNYFLAEQNALGDKAVLRNDLFMESVDRVSDLCR